MNVSLTDVMVSDRMETPATSNNTAAQEKGEVILILLTSTIKASKSASNCLQDFSCILNILSCAEERYLVFANFLISPYNSKLSEHHIICVLLMSRFVTRKLQCSLKSVGSAATSW